jgi:hypothetical protein
MKPPEQCNCYAHLAAAANDYAGWSHDTKLLRKVRRDKLAHARELRTRAEQWRQVGDKIGTDGRRESDSLEAVAVCAEWGAWLCLERLRKIQKAARKVVTA